MLLENVKTEQWLKKTKSLGDEFDGAHVDSLIWFHVHARSCGFNVAQVHVEWYNGRLANACIERYTDPKCGEECNVTDISRITCT